MLDSNEPIIIRDPNLLNEGFTNDLASCLFYHKNGINSNPETICSIIFEEVRSSFDLHPTSLAILRIEI